jgi:hypothetical protein
MDRAPCADLASDKNGDLFGSTNFGGGSKKQFGSGVVFELKPPRSGTGLWKEVILYRFQGPPDGMNPQYGILRAANGSLYGTTNGGGPAGWDAKTMQYGGLCGHKYGRDGCGTVFKLTKPASGTAPWTERILYSFAGGSDGANPGRNDVRSDESGNLFGMTAQGGNSDNGVVFELRAPAKASQVNLKAH